MIESSGGTAAVEVVDAVVIGAGFCGLYATWRLVHDGYTVRSFEAAPDVGGVWYWNRYPGAQTDSPGYTYQFTFDDALLSEWRYSRKNPTQPEVFAYLSTVADRFGLRSKYHFGTKVTALSFDEVAGVWDVTSDQGHHVRANYVIAGLGFVSEPVLPNYPGIESFSGQIVYTAKWPQGGVDYAGKRVALIGTGSSGIQIAPYLAQDAAKLTVFQRTPNYAVPAGNFDMSEQDWQDILADFDEIKRRIRNHPSSFPFAESVGRLALEATPEEREAIFEEMWNKGGFSFLYEAFDDIAVSKEANDLACEFLRRKIRSIVEDPAIAELLVPTYPYGAKRPPTSEGYFEIFNQPNVELVSVRNTPIVEFASTGIRTTAKTEDFDIVVFATGFDAGTGPYDRIDITGRGGRKLKEHWATGPSTYLAMAVHGFPNLLLTAGPQSPFTNLPPGAELEGGWAIDLITFAREHGYALLEPTAGAEAQWNHHVEDIASNSLMVYAASVNSWFTGANIEGKPVAYYNYFGGGKAYGDLLDQERADGFPSFTFAADAAQLDDREREQSAGVRG